jgi:hypothetical protein
MPKRVFRIREGEPLLDIVSYGSGGHRENGRRPTLEQVEQIRRTVRREPEVMVKVLPRASNDLSAAGKHLDYISRGGRLELETDDGADMRDKKGDELLEEWDLDIDDVRRQGSLAGTQRRKLPKLVHKLMFSMPAGVPPEKVLAAVRNFAREEFWGKHRYAFVLHTDEDHPHVHLVLKAVSEQGDRLNIRKATLRHWRSEFARNLRLLGVEANATERAVRGQTRKAVKDGIYRSSARGDSSFMSNKVEAVASELRQGKRQSESGKRRLIQTRSLINSGWRGISEFFLQQGDSSFSAQVARFIDEMPDARTDRDRIAAGLLDEIPRSKENPGRTV